MNCNVILVGGQKGGTGKSTIATNLAWMFASQGLKTMLLDCDLQATSFSFWSRRERHEFDCAVAAHGDGFDLDTFDLTLHRYRDEYDVVVIDVGGHDSVHLRAAMASEAVDLMLTPILPSFADVETLVRMDDLIGEAKKYNANLRAYCLVNRCHPNLSVRSRYAARDFVRKYCKHMDVLDQFITERVDYRYALGAAESVIEYLAQRKKAKAAVAELQILYKLVSGCNYKTYK